MAADDDSNARGELARIARGVRERLEWQARGGVVGLPRGGRAAGGKGAATAATQARGDARESAATAMAPVAKPTVGARAATKQTVAAKPAAASSAAATAPAASSAAPLAPAAVGAEGAGRAATARGAEGLRVLREEIGDCQRCKLAKARTNLVFGVGNPEAALVFVGEGPGADEDRLGEPFVGKAGQLLDKMILAMGFDRSEVYICNVVKCRPPGNRTPEPDEVAECEPFLVKQLGAIRPKVIVALGKSAAQALLKTDAPISRFRGQFTTYQGIPLMPTFHPAYLLRTPSAKREVWEDLKQVMAELDRQGVPRRKTGDSE